MLLNTGLVLVSYLIGSIPTGLLLGRAFAKIDIREHGSHNIGATNVYRSAGKMLGILTLLGDTLKGFLPVYLVYTTTGSETWASLSALATFLGHLYPVYLKFSGGKGVATGLGVFLFLAPQTLIFCLGIFCIVLALFRYVSLSSISAALALPLLMIFSPHPYPWLYSATAAFLAIMIIFRHQENIKRLIKGEEHKIGGKVLKH
ncbi:MAG: glycerol-3-phosphate 1-O-acyltransferase PlsY [Thermodesulfobacteriota bacterium]|nr:MAG: glycerol-3-phosphate 1-O-acyltransferase PlsY [Thermodesulfobacteriota bacterium]